MLDYLTTSTVFAIFLIFCRVGSMFMAIPGIGEAYVPIRIRLLLSVAVALLLFTALKTHLPALPSKVPQLAQCILVEILVGIFIGLLARVLMATMHVAGMIIATVSGLSAATLFDPNQGAQSAIVGNFLTVLVVTILFATNTDHMLLRAVFDSYTLFPAGKWPLIGDMTEVMTKTAADSFMIAVQLTVPQLVVSLVLFVGTGIMSRLMPAMQVFFILMPIQITLSFFVAMITLSAGIFWYVDHVHEVIEGYIVR